MKKYSFNDDWIFSKKDTEGTQAVSLPHDAMILEKRSQDSPGGSAVGYFNSGIYEYKKTFDVPVEFQDKEVILQFEGVYKDSTVTINGEIAGGSTSGYFPFFVPAKNLLRYGEKNTIVVTVDNSDMPNSRWYTGAGIYRPVWLWIGEKSHINIEGVRISTLSYQPARILVETEITGEGEVEIEILRGEKIVSRGSGASAVIDIADADLWSGDSPSLYKCRVKLKKDGKEIDEMSETFGIRMIEWGAKGFFINGEKTLLRGGCVHHDNGILGARSFEKSEERRVLIMKKAGYNAIRSSHNPAAKSLLEACDKHGIYMIDETWDMWYHGKSKNDNSLNFEKSYKDDLKTLVERDFNHPSVIMYSIGNEITEPAEKRGVELTKEMVEILHSLDNTRPVTCGANLWLINETSKGKGIYQEGNEVREAPKEMNSTIFNMITSQVGTNMNNGAVSDEADAVVSPFLDELDIAGYNYSSGRYPLEGKSNPKRVVVGSETFPQDIAKNWEMVKNHPYLIGDFVWTSWDYLGEVGIGAWAYTDDAMSFNKPYPWLLADTGTIDILGNIGPGAEYAAVVWGVREKPYICVRPVNHPGIEPIQSVWRGTNAIPSWAWKDCDGNKAVVEVYADACEVELFLNGKSVEKKKIHEYKAIFTMDYSPGTLSAVTYDSMGKKTGENELLSSSKKTKVDLKPEELTVEAGEIVYVNISVVGGNGVVEMNDDRKLNLEVENGELLAFGSANPRTEERFESGSYTTYFGRAQAVVKAKGPGDLIIFASDEKHTSKAVITVKKAKEII